MLITERIRINRIIRGTWTEALFCLGTCVAAHLLSTYVLQRHFAFPALLPSILGTALAFFIGFNNNQAYGRWWEARIIWGAIINESRTWARQCLHYVAPDPSSAGVVEPRVDRMVRRQLAFVYALKEALRGTSDRVYRAYLLEAELSLIERARNKHNAILSLQAQELQAAYAAGLIDGFKFIELDRTLANLCSEMGKAERIKNTIFPTTYNYYTRAFTYLFIISVTLVISKEIGAPAILFGFMVGYVFLTVHAIGRMLLNPFDPLPAGIPLDQIARTIEIGLLEMLGETALPEPVQAVNGEYVL